MAKLILLVYFFTTWTCLVHAAYVSSNGTSYSGLYSPQDKVDVLTKANFEGIYGKPHSWLIEFYNSYCGYCIKYSSVFKTFAADVYFWRPVVRIAVIDCSDDANNDICRDFEIVRYPTMRYFHENYFKDHNKLGEELIAGPTPNKMKEILITKLRAEEASGAKTGWPKLSIQSYDNKAEAIEDIPANNKATFIMCDEIESESFTCDEVALDTNDYQGIVVKCVDSASPLCHDFSSGAQTTLTAIRPNLETTPLKTADLSRESFVNAINSYMKENGLPLPNREHGSGETDLQPTTETSAVDYSATIFLSDLEASLRFALTKEISMPKMITGDARLALIEFLQVCIDLFPFAGNGKKFVSDLKDIVESRNEWSGSDLKKIIHEKELAYTPVYGTNAEWIGCKGSSPHYRGYTCGLWQIFHALTVAAANNNGDGPRVLRAMYYYITNFLGCYDCQQHFKAMAAKNKIFDVNDNKKAVLWLWISHNEVNLRLAGDGSEDPQHPKVQFPTLQQCNVCRDHTRAWNLQEVYSFLRMIYGNSLVKEKTTTEALSAGPLDRTDVGLLSILYIVSFIIIIVVGNYFFNGKLKKQRPYGYSMRSKA